MLVNTDIAAQWELQAPRQWASLDAFLADMGTRAFRFAEAGLRHYDDALDAVQEAMLKMMNYQERPSTEWPPLFWSILRRKIIDMQRRRRFRFRWMVSAEDYTDTPLVDWTDHGTPGPARHHEQQESYARLVEALRKLPTRQREAFMFRVMEGLDVATTAQAMNCSEGSVKTHLSRAREALQKQLEDFK